MIDVIKRLEKDYNVDIGKFLFLYKRKVSRENIENELNLSTASIRVIGVSLGLRFTKKYREVDYDLLQAKLKKDKGENPSLVDDLLRDIENLSKESYKNQKALLKCKEQNKVLKTMNKHSLSNTLLLENLKEQIKLSLQDIEIIETKIDKIDFGGKDSGKVMVVLSDLHLGANVEKVDFSEDIEYNWNIAISRLDKLFEEAIENSPLKIEEILIVGLGDLFDGVIHNSDLISEYPVTEVVAKFAVYLTNKIHTLSNFAKVRVDLVTGNHERLKEHIALHKKGFDFTYLFYELLKANFTNKSNVIIKYHINGYGLIHLGCDKSCLITHGDIDRKFKPFIESEKLKIVEKCESLFNVKPYIVLTGHNHQYSKSLLNYGGYCITSASMLGVNGYSFNSGFPLSKPSQVVLYLRDNGELLYEKVVFF